MSALSSTSRIRGTIHHHRDFFVSPVRPDNRPPTRNDSARARHERRTRCAYRATAALCATLLPIAAVVGASLENASAVTRVAVAWAIASLAAVAVCAYATAAGEELMGLIRAAIAVKSTEHRINLQIARRELTARIVDDVVAE